MKTKIMENNSITDLWNNYVLVERPNTSGWMISIAYFLMKIKDNPNVKRDNIIKCHVLTQSLNPNNMDNYIENIAESVCRRNCKNNKLFEKYMKYKIKFLASQKTLS